MAATGTTSSDSGAGIPGRVCPLPARIGACLYLAFSCATSFALTWPPPEPVQDRLDRAVGLLERIEAALPASVADVDTLADRLDYDIDAAIAYVHEEVRFEPYVGVLRGPDGTALAARGNAWDQALLLAALINTMGGEAQVVVGTISAQDASTMLNRTFVVPEQDRSPFDPEVLNAMVREYRPELAASLERRQREWEKIADSTNLDRRAAAIGSSLLELLNESGVPLPGERSSEALADALSNDYAWVRWRDRAADQWLDLHPAYPADEPPAAEPEHYFEGEIPENYQHRLAFRLLIERKKAGDGEVETLPIMDRFEGPTAQLFKDQIGIGIGPTRVDGAQSFVVPLLNGRLAPGAQAVTELGLIAPAGDAAAAPGELFATLSSRLGGAIGKLDEATGGTAGTGPRLTGILLEVAMVSPGGHRSTLERRLVDLHDDDGQNFPDAAAFDMVLDVDLGTESSARTSRRLVEHDRRLLQAIPVFLGLARDAIGLDEAMDMPQMQALNHSVWPSFDLLAGVLLPDATPDEVAFRPGPFLAARRTFVDPDRGVVSISDILHNPVTVLKRNEGGRLSVDNNLAVLQGARETLIESDLMHSSGHWAERAPASLVTRRADLASNATTRHWPRAAVLRAANDLEDGYLLAVTRDPEPHWWRIDPRSGQTLGMGTWGGQSVAEYVVMITGAALSAWLFKESVESCDEKYAKNREMADCCIVGNLLATYGTAAVGGAMSLPNAEAYIFHPWAASVGYITAAVGFEASYNMAIGAATEQPIKNICAAYLNQ